jgi:hypothetical protein
VRLALAALALAAVACGPRPPAAEDPQGPLFREAAGETGLRFTHNAGASGRFYMPEIMGAGVALIDYDGDGDLDVYFVQGAPLDAAKPPAGHSPGNRLFRNELIPTGVLRFTDVTAEAGAGHIAHGMGVATGDYDNDGDVDLYVTNFGGNVLYRNDGGRFTNVTRAAGADDDRWSTSAAFLDYDRDGDLDLFVLNYVDFTVRGNKRCQNAAGEPDYCTPKAYRPVTARLFRNEGGGRFTDVSNSSGITAAYGPGLGVTCGDFNGDGWVDLYVANDTAANLLWINQRDGTFKEAGLGAGAAYAEDGLPRAGMGVSAGDFDNDGDDDLIVVNLTREGATLFRSDGAGGFQDATLPLGLKPPTFAYTGFGVDWIDYDNDGWLDLFIANGAVTVMESLRGQPWPFHQRNLLIRNEGGKRFVDVTDRAGPAISTPAVSRGAAFGDIDNDGDVDIVVSVNNGPARLLLNESARQGTFHVEPSPFVQGAAVIVKLSDGRTLVRRAHTDSSYLSASDPRVHFGIGNAHVDSVTVRRLDGTTERWDKPAGPRFVARRGTGVK